MLIAPSRLLTAWGRPAPATRRVLVVNGHPDPRPERYCAALCEAYANGARSVGHRIRSLQVGNLPLSTEAIEFAVALEQLLWSDQIFVAFPIWFSGPPPAVSRLFEAFAREEKAIFKESPDPPAQDRGADLVITATMPSLLYRSSDSLSATLPGTRPSAPTIIGSIDTISNDDRNDWLDQMKRLGARIS